MDILELADSLKALGDPTRLKMIALLKLRDFCVCEFVPIFKISQPAVSKHVGRLKAAGFVTETRKGQWVIYSLNRSRLAEVGYGLSQLPDLSAEIEELGKQGLLVTCE
ncbi:MULTISPECIES: ArsR/SmtB family transcription factor [Brevibacillus]|uniref:ArsR/SmtB family transcription factor n=1 Tax=Brevibacillus TaxID=55080 RepID=UPI000EB8FA96|nr:MULTISPECIES: metalloregulator ArsR/SmtB family transcription factor [Brevibacillus]TGV06453.1 ArsR family transcriptional regulator [Mesorhizobium sp. M00.F.Ca.ET.186.01.1.1]MDH6352240.1 ArsR family transcriptional regulator [Brevibacillus sp. 1238]MDR4998893.1 metalloregulator ArsR/SmtB family transcription factor [Brevibacillus parabrevis]MED1722272.1 metalloregulator ArsR/SmtB family transcription factor [Brevibacillus parabrevis]MED2254542.1 metalloregulator ArsR/SmtB family transcript